MMSIELALRNVRKNLREYTVYFLTLTFGVCVFYSFNAIESQQAIMGASASNGRVFKEFTQIIGIVSVFVSIILGLLILYANRFLIRRRKKEFGVYLTLGMNRGQISRILIGETVLVGLFSLAAGLALGVSLSQGMAVLTAKLMKVPVERLQFVFSAQSLIKTVVYFGVVFGLLLVFNAFMISRQKLIDLLYADRRSEWFKTPKLAQSVVVFVISLVCLGWAYGTVLTGGTAKVLDSASLRYVILAGVVGTFLFFFSLSGFLLKVFQQTKSVYLKGLNAFVLRQLSSKINTAYVSITMVCLMLFVSICTLCAGLGLSTSISQELRRGTPFDATFSTAARSNQAEGSYSGVDLPAALAQIGLPLGSVASQSLVVRYYEAGLTVPLMVRENGFEQRHEAKTYLLKLSDYNAVLRLMGQAPIALSPGHYAINYAVANAAMKRATQEYVDSRPTIAVNGVTLSAGPDTFHDNVMEVLQNQDYKMTLVVPDHLVTGLAPARDALHLNYLDPKDRSESLVQQAHPLLRAELKVDVSLWTRQEVEAFGNSTSVLVAYVAIYLGIVFLIASAAVLAIGQLSEMSDSLSRYGALRKIGVEDKMLNRSIFAQVLVYFGLPMALAAVHSVIGVAIAEQVVSAFDKGSVLGSSLFTAAVLLIVYGGYFLATYQGGKAMLRRQYAQSRRGVD
ncbi:MAG: ABC transporter permease [Propionibacteriaceae bacterium]|jgi:putative ABC transport system permease protein|nr:ABC transporter permease [Propionibacteriaceae bacterium]